MKPTPILEALDTELAQSMMTRRAAIARGASAGSAVMAGLSMASVPVERDAGFNVTYYGAEITHHVVDRPLADVFDPFLLAGVGNLRTNVFAGGAMTASSIAGCSRQARGCASRCRTGFSFASMPGTCSRFQRRRMATGAHPTASS